MHLKSPFGTDMISLILLSKVLVLVAAFSHTYLVIQVQASSPRRAGFSHPSNTIECLVISLQERAHRNASCATTGVVFGTVDFWERVEEKSVGKKRSYS